jgi:glycosyltransferase involved in cell wall biosynthesis
MNPLLSIIIPTKNRYHTLFSIVDTIISFNDLLIEIVIQDNSDDNSSALEFIQKREQNNSLKYFYSAEKLSVIENSDLAVLNSTGEYVCFIGDDDGVMPYIGDVVKWMKRNGHKALKAHKPNYFWPSMITDYFANDNSGILYESNYNYNIKEVSTCTALNYTLSKGGTSIKKLPCLYHGIVDRETLDRIFIKCNTYFPGPSPDMANAIALSLFLNKYVYVDFPVIISGKSKNSTGGQGVLHQHISKIEEVTHLPIKTSDEWTEQIPKYWTGPTIWAESVIKSLMNTGNEIEIEKFRFSYLYASIYLFNFKSRHRIFHNFSFNIFSSSFLLDLFKLFFIRVYFFLNNRFNFKRINKTNNVTTIGKAISILNKNIDQKKLAIIIYDNQL